MHGCTISENAYFGKVNPSEVIIYKAESPEAFKAIVEEAVDYALLSFPFTVNRMSLSGLSQRISNIAKGKLAEGMLRAFANSRGLEMDFTAGETPFWMRDAFDFRWKGLDWDLKNNFIYHPEPRLPAEVYLKLPALVPNRFPGDQWDSGDDKKKGYLFSFIRQAVKRGQPGFMELQFNAKSLVLLNELAEQYAGNFPDRAPYSTDWFWGNLQASGGKPKIIIRDSPALIITGVCTQADRARFLDTDGHSGHGYAHYLGGWYKPQPKGGIAFNGGILHTKITNATCPIGFLKGLDV